MVLVRALCTTVVLLSCGAVVSADVLTLRNGDRMTGTFVSIRTRILSFQTDSLGVVTMPVGQVSAVSLDQMVTVTALTRGGPSPPGWLAVDATGSWQIIGNDDGVSRTLGLGLSDVILPVQRYQSIVGHVASPWEDWRGTANFGYSMQRGNQQTNTFSSSVDAIRERPTAPLFRQHWRTNGHVLVLLSNAVQSGTSIGTNTLSGSLRQDRLLAPGNFIFGIAQFDHVGTEGLSLRQTYGGGSGYDVDLARRGTMSIFAGLTFVRERFAIGADRQSAQVLIGEKFRFRLAPRIRLDHAANAYPNITLPGQFHLDARTAVDIALTNRFALNTALIDLYLSNPSAGSQRNNFSLTTGITATF
jgi:hypothetical protein